MVGDRFFDKVQVVRNPGVKAGQLALDAPDWSSARHSDEDVSVHDQRAPTVALRINPSIAVKVTLEVRPLRACTGGTHLADALGVLGVSLLHLGADVGAGYAGHLVSPGALLVRPDRGVGEPQLLVLLRGGGVFGCGPLPARAADHGRLAHVRLVRLRGTKPAHPELHLWAVKVQALLELAKRSIGALCC